MGVVVGAPTLPGGIATNLQRHQPAGYLAERARELGAAFRPKTPAQGAATSVLVAVSPLLESVGGRYSEHCEEAERITGQEQLDGMHGVAPYALDPANAERLWDQSERWLRA